MTRPILLDTNILIWALNDDRRLTRRVRTALASPASDVRVSVVSAWEIAIKHQSGKLLLDAPIEAVLSRILSGAV
jgi:PIN domain nuclease of toxin-antitoxin system